MQLKYFIPKKAGPFQKMKRDAIGLKVQNVYIYILTLKDRTIPFLLLDSENRGHIPRIEADCRLPGLMVLGSCEHPAENTHLSLQVSRQRFIV